MGLALNEGRAGGRSLAEFKLPGARQRRCRQVAKWVKQGQLWQASKARIPGFEQKQPCSTPRGMFVAAISAGDLYKPPGMAPGRCFPLFSKLPVGRTNRGGGGGGGSSIREPSLSGLTRFRGQIPYMAAAAIRPTLCFPGRREPFRPSIICLILLGQTARVPSARALPQPPQSAQPASSSLKPAPQVADWARGDRERHGRQCLKGSSYSACHQRCSGGPTAGMSCRPDTQKQDGGSRRSINVQ